MKPNTNPFRGLILVLFVVALVFCGTSIYRTASAHQQTDRVYSDIRTLFEQEKVDRFTVDDNNNLTITLKDPVDGSRIVVYSIYNFQLFYDDFNDLVVKQYESGILSSYDYPDSPSPAWMSTILTWVVVLLLLGTLTSLITCSFTHNYIVLLKDSLLPFATSIFCISFLVVSGILVSMSITGTVFTNILFSGILLFLPRFCAFALQNSMVRSLPFLTDSMNMGFFRNGNNLLFAGVSAVFGITDSGTVAEDVLSPGWQPLLYTFLLGLLYFLIAASLSARRRSEAAGQSAPSRLLQHIYRIVVTMTICIFIACMLYMDIVNHTARNGWFM